MRTAMHSWWGERKVGNTEKKTQCFAFGLHRVHRQMRNESIWLCGGGCVCKRDGDGALDNTAC